MAISVVSTGAPLDFARGKRHAALRASVETTESYAESLL
jgi:hypothetical protein